MSFMKRVDEARKAFSKRDIDASAAVHAPERIKKSLRMAKEEHGGAGSQYIGDFVYGGLDGVITTFAVVSGVAGANLGSEIVLILGLANLFADGFSMATGAYLSVKSEQEYYKKERERELWEVKHFPEGERTELREIYQGRGFSPEEANQLVEIYSRDDEWFVDAMMVDELGMLKDESNPVFNGLATLVAFVLVGVVPLLIYLLGLAFPIDPELDFPLTILLSAIALFGLGAGKVAVTHQHPIKSGMETLLIGALAASVAYGVGALLKGLGI